MIHPKHFITSGPDMFCKCLFVSRVSIAENCSALPCSVMLRHAHLSSGATSSEYITLSKIIGAKELICQFVNRTVLFPSKDFTAALTTAKSRVACCRRKPPQRGPLRRSLHILAPINGITYLLWILAPSIWQYAMAEIRVS